jgi:hypothetical protein
MCCVLFICLEFLQGNTDTAISHLLSGLDIMAVWRTRNCKLLHDEALSITSELHPIPDNLVRKFSRLTIQSMLCGRDPLTSSSDVLEADLSALTPVVFSSLQAARTSLDFLMKISHQILLKSHEPDFQLQPETNHRLDTLTNALDKWSLSFDLFLVSSSATPAHQEIRATTNLRILNIVAKIWLSSSVSTEESIFDEQTEAFSATVNLA